MEYLTTSQIADYNNPMAFARTRTTRVGQTEIGSANQRTVRTNDIEESYRLVLGATEKLEILSGNLNTMLELTDSGMRNSSDSRKQEETYGKLRSLSAGFDQVVEAIRFDGESIFTNKPIVLNQGPGTRDLLIDPVSLFTHGDNSLDLSQKTASASAGIKYRTDDYILNDPYDIVGLEIAKASYIEGSNSALELETGVYKVGIQYSGSASSVELRTQQGDVIQRKNADLSGSGKQWIDFDSGVRLEFVMEDILSPIDKHEYSTLDPSPEYLRSFTYSNEQINENQINILNTDDYNLDEYIKIKQINFPTSSSSHNYQNDESYFIDIEYKGDSSFLKIKDANDQLIENKIINLSGDNNAEPKTIILDSGVELTFELSKRPIDKYDFYKNGPARLSATLNYERINKHVLRTDSKTFITSPAEFLMEAELSIGSGQLKILNPKQAPIDDINRPLETGNYTVEVEYYGDKSLVRLNNELGILQSFLYDVDLSGNGIHSINFGNGLSFEVHTKDFEGDGSILSSVLSYKQDTPDLEDFDFREYAERIRDALLIVDEQLLVMAEAQSRIEETNQLRNSANTSSAPNSAAFNAASANLLLSGGGGGGLFGAISSGARFGVLSTQLFETTAAFQTQANQTPQELAQLSIQGSAASVLSTFA
jgi:hypothetical protein